MSLIKPISFLQKKKIAAVTPGGFPTLNGTVWDVWETDSGITLDGTKVTSWTGNQNSRVMSNYATNTGPFLTTSDSNFNSEDSINFSLARLDGLSIEGTNIQGTNDGSLHYCIYGITKYTSGDLNGQFGFYSPQPNTPFNFVEAALFVNSSTNQQIYAFNPSPTVGTFVNSDDDTLGKGIYTISIAPGTDASKYYNKGTTVNASWSYSSYLTARTRPTIGAYNSAELGGSIDVVAAVVWYNSTNLTADITSLQTYFQTKYGT
jgi:hypothetical protein